MNRGPSGRANPRFQSPGILTPARRMQTEFPEEEFDFSSPIFSEQLQKRLEDLESSGDTPTKNEFIQSVGILESDRRKTATEGREKALHSVLNLLSNKYEPELMSQQLFATIYDELVSARSEIEVILCSRLVIVAIASFDDNDPHLADCLEKVKAKLLALLLKRAREREDADAFPVPARAAMVTCYAVLQFLLNVGGGGFGVEEMIIELLDLAEGTKDSEAPLATAAIQGIGLLAVIVSQGAAISLMPDLSLSLAQFLGSMNPDLAQASAKTAGVLFEKCHSPANSLQGADDLIEALETMANDSSKRIAKRDKKSRKSVARDVLVTARAPEHEGEEDEDNEDKVLTHFRLSPNRSLMVKSWSVLSVIQHLRWVFGPGLYTHLANNPTLVSVLDSLAEEGANGEIDFDFKEDTIDSHEEALRSEPRAQKRDVDIRKARLEKVSARDVPQ